MRMSVKQAQDSPAKIALYEQFLHLKKTARADISSVEQRPELIPMSFAQQHLRYLEQVGGAGTVHNLSYEIRCDGALDLSALSAVLDEIVYQQEVLRTHCPVVKGQEVQAITPAETGKLDSRKVDKSDVGDASARFSNQPFDIANDCLYRFALVKIGNEARVLGIVVRRIVFDRWSIGDLLRELVTLYDPRVLEGGMQLSPLSIQYAAYAIWQQKIIENNELREKLTYWRDKLSGFSNRNPPTDYLRLPIHTSRGDQLGIHIPSAIIETLSDVARRARSTLNMVLLSAFQIVLWLGSDQDDFVMGTTFARRRYAKVKLLISFLSIPLYFVLICPQI